MAARVKFRFLISKHGTNLDLLMPVYGTKFSALMNEVLHTKLTQLDYDDLPNLREHVSPHSKITDYTDVLDNVLVEKKRLLLDATPMFNLVPEDLKAFILLAVGVRSSHFLKRNCEVING